MRIALVGNMNNNNFAILRYLRDLGEDAHLLLNKNDGTGTLAHFSPESDTWEIEKWSPYIHQTEIHDSNISILGNKMPYNLVYYPRYIYKLLTDPSNSSLYKPVTKNSLNSTYKGYDAYIGSGLSPSILARVGINLDIFYPYGIGIENLGDRPTKKILNNSPLIKKAITKEIVRRQKQSIKSAKNCINSDLSLTKDTFEEINVPFLPWFSPMIYNNESKPSLDKLSPVLQKTYKDIATRDFTIIMHSRQMWVNPGEYSTDEWEDRSKHNEWLIKSFAQLLKTRKGHNCALYLLEYGPDVEASKVLCAELGIQENVIWLPKMTRKELMLILSWCDIGTGEFVTEHGCMWGGTAWETLASGKPLIQGLCFDENEFQSEFGFELPPMLAVKKEQDILNHLQDAVDAPEKMKQIGTQSHKWFNDNNGIGLAKKWINLIKTKGQY
mgnify:CR=1 FL=1